MMLLTVKLPGNPDYQQYAPIGPELRVMVKDAAQGVANARGHAVAYNAGGGNFIADLSVNGQRIARIAFNGSLWPDTPWFSGQKGLSVEDVDEMAVLEGMKPTPAEKPKMKKQRRSRRPADIDDGDAPAQRSTRRRMLDEAALARMESKS